ncbi:hypothetical protein BDA99DRAFT_334704 [Phascolomyces articulosus]|uniref:RRM Nup35-type domain-containing protein n=1 Tax=Phascolomyces articulosus TaxID=60185 RepID=A0AAD5JL26_9FUNG|nr:hypothetical protein BDA99DRAFT_334704 [Phascolomyces articulosus]
MKKFIYIYKYLYYYRRRTLYKQSSNNSGVFGMHDDVNFGDSSTRSTKEIDDPPVVSIWDIGVNPRKYSTSSDTTKTSNKPDLWTLAVMQPQNNSGKSSFMSQDNNNSTNNKDRNNSLLSSTMNTTTTCSVPHHHSNTNSSSNDTKGPKIIKVFGYPSELQVAVIEFFTRCGNIEERYQSNSNWMTFRYEKSEGAKEALLNHGKIITKDCMVGVVVAKTMTG